MLSRCGALLALCSLTACAPSVVPPIPNTFFSSNSDAVIRECPLPAIDSLAPCRLRVPRSLHELEQIAATNGKLGAIGDTLTFAVIAPGARSIRISGGVELPMLRSPNSEIWVGSIHVPRASHAVISYRVFTDITRNIPLRFEFRGDSAPVRPPRAQQLRGTIRVDTLLIRGLGVRREVIAYVPHKADEQARSPVVYLPDGGLVKQIAPILDTLIAARQLRPVVLVGVRAAPQAMRTREYVLGFDKDSTRFRAHEQFFVKDVASWAENQLPITNARAERMLWGASNGGAFVVAMGLRHPERYAHVFASSPVFERVPPPLRGLTRPTFHIAAGTFEGTTRDRAFGLVQVLRDFNARSEFHELVAGHDEIAWIEWLVRMLRYVQSAVD